MGIYDINDDSFQNVTDDINPNNKHVDKVASLEDGDNLYFVGLNTNDQYRVIRYDLPTHTIKSNRTLPDDVTEVDDMKTYVNPSDGQTYLYVG